jgi:hypothetical protein
MKTRKHLRHEVIHDLIAVRSDEVIRRRTRGKKRENGSKQGRKESEKKGKE